MSGSLDVVKLFFKSLLVLQFLTRISTLTRDIDISIQSVRLSVTRRYSMGNGLTYTL